MVIVDANEFKILAVLTLAVLVISLINTFQISEIRAGDSATIQSSTSQDTGGSSGSTTRVQEIRSEVLPDKGSPTGYGIAYSKQGMQQMVSWQKNITLSGEDRKQYVRVGTQDGTACGYCCGATAALRKDGTLACGCAHNYALAGLIKNLVKNTDMTDQEIMQEVQNWKAYFFPKEVLKEELQKRGISPSAAGLPEMRGGC